MLWALRCERVSNVACQSHPDKRRSACNNTSLLCFTPTHWVQRLPQNTTACICDLQGLGIGRRTWWLAIFLVEIQNSNFLFHLSDSEPPLATCTSDKQPETLQCTQAILFLFYICCCTLNVNVFILFFLFNQNSHNTMVCLEKSPDFLEILWQL